MATATLNDIKKKVRRITRSLSTNILSEADLEQYINTFVLYDFPEHLRMSALETTLSFYTKPYKDVYETNTSTATDPLYNFKNKYITVHPPVYVAGNQAVFSESREEFFAQYPQVRNIQSIGTTGNGSATSYTGTVPVMQSNNTSNPTVILKNSVLFDSIDANYNGLSLIDEPVTESVGNLYAPNGTKPSFGDAVDPNNNINYITGVYTITFGAAPKSGNAINVQSVIVQPARPMSVLFYDNKFTVRPVPDQPYQITMNVFKQPTELLANGDNPDLNEWWEYIAFGAARKVFEDRMDVESIQMIQPMFKEQERLINRRTVVQQTSQRTPTIYTSKAADAYGAGFFNGGGQF